MLQVLAMKIVYDDCGLSVDDKDLHECAIGQTGKWAATRKSDSFYCISASKDLDSSLKKRRLLKAK
jgi:hypothetical protein